jgi:hypothetical protein
MRLIKALLQLITVNCQLHKNTNWKRHWEAGNVLPVMIPEVVVAYTWCQSIMLATLIDNFQGLAQDNGNPSI